MKWPQCGLDKISKVSFKGKYSGHFEHSKTLNSEKATVWSAILAQRII